MHLDPFELHRPTDVAGALAIAGGHPGAFDFLAGGTDLLPNYKMKLNVRPHLIALDQVEELRGRTLARLGAMDRLADVERDVGFCARWPAVGDAAREVATPLVRASATVGGNLLVETRCFFFNQSLPWRESLGYCLKADGDRCHVVPQKTRCYATFSGDLAPALLVHEAEVEVAGPAGRRRVALSEFYDEAGDGIRRHHLGPGELLVAVHLPDGTPPMASSYRKLRVRPAFDFPELGVAVACELDGEHVRTLRLAVGGLESYPRRFDALTQPLEGQRLTKERIHELSSSVVAQVRPVHNTFLPPDYRRRMTGVFVRRLLESTGRGAVASS